MPSDQIQVLAWREIEGMASATERAKRALVVVMRALAMVYGLSLDVNRDAPDVRV